MYYIYVYILYKLLCYIYIVYYILYIIYILYYIYIYTWAHQASRLNDLGGRRAYQASLREQYVYIVR